LAFASTSLAAADTSLAVDGTEGTVSIPLAATCTLVVRITNIVLVASASVAIVVSLPLIIYVSCRLGSGSCSSPSIAKAVAAYSREATDCRFKPSASCEQRFKPCNFASFVLKL